MILELPAPTFRVKMKRRAHILSAIFLQDHTMPVVHILQRIVVFSHNTKRQQACCLHGHHHLITRLFHRGIGEVRQNTSEVSLYTFNLCKHCKNMYSDHGSAVERVSMATQKLNCRACNHPNGPRFESGRGRCVESLDKALYSHCPKEKPSH